MVSMNGIVSRRWLSRALGMAGVALGGAVGVGVGLGYLVSEVLTRPRRSGPYDEYVMTPFETGADYEDISFPALDAEHTLHGWWLPRPGSRRVIIGCHGYRGGKFELVGIGSALWRAGFNVLLFDFHGHRPGHGARVSLGYHAVEDLHSAIAEVRRRVAEARIGVIGFSMGASVAIIGAARFPELRAVVADTPFSTHTAVVRHGVRRMSRMPAAPLVWIADFFLAWRTGYRGRDVEPVREVAAIAPRPLLLIHGTEDTISPLAQGMEVFAAAGEPKELWIADGAPHCGAYFLDRETYSERVIAFFERSLPAEAAPPRRAASAEPRAEPHAGAQESA